MGATIALWPLKAIGLTWSASGSFTLARLIRTTPGYPRHRWPPKPPTEADLAVARVLSGKIIALGAGQKNITIRLRQKNRTLNFD